MGTNVDKAQNMGKRQNKDLMTAILLKLNHNLPYRKIQEITGVDDSTIHVNYHKLMRFFNPEQIGEYEKKKPEILSGMEQAIIEKMLDEKTLKKASFNNLAYGLQNVNNINRLHRGLSTSNVSVNSLTASLSEIVEEEKKLQKQLEDRK